MSATRIPSLKRKEARMTQNESLLHGWFAAGDRGDTEAFERYLHADVVVHAPMGLSTEGIEAEKAVWRAALAAIPDLKHEIKELVMDGSTIAARVEVSGTLQGEFAGISGTGQRFTIDQATFARIRDGKAAEIWEVADTGSLLRQVG
jgi:predicted ester cyclase